jgi:hypothetical protein
MVALGLENGPERGVGGVVGTRFADHGWLSSLPFYS